MQHSSYNCSPSVASWNWPTTSAKFCPMSESQRSLCLDGQWHSMWPLCLFIVIDITWSKDFLYIFKASSKSMSVFAGGAMQSWLQVRSWRFLFCQFSFILGGCWDAIPRISSTAKAWTFPMDRREVWPFLTYMMWHSAEFDCLLCITILCISIPHFQLTEEIDFNYWEIEQANRSSARGAMGSMWRYRFQNCCHIFFIKIWSHLR